MVDNLVSFDKNSFIVHFTESIKHYDILSCVWSSNIVLLLLLLLLLLNSIRATFHLPMPSPPHCEPEGGLWSKWCAASPKDSWKYTNFQHNIQSSHSPDQQFSLSLVEAEYSWTRFPLSKAGQLIQQGWLPCRRALWWSDILSKTLPSMKIATTAADSVDRKENSVLHILHYWVFPTLSPAPSYFSTFCTTETDNWTIQNPLVRQHRICNQAKKKL